MISLLFNCSAMEISSNNSYNKDVILPIALAKTGLHILLTPQVIFVILALLLAIWLTFTWMFRYHWKNYGTGKLEVLTMTFFYLGGSAILLGLTVTSAFAYFFSSI